MRILVLGARGMMGHMTCRILSQNHEVIGTVRNQCDRLDSLLRFVDREHLAEGITTDDMHGLRDLIEAFSPDVVVNCIGIVKQLEAASDAIMSIRCNSLMPHELAALCEHGPRLIHLSTDCVFSGSRGNYQMEDNPDPVDLYGRSKLLGELSESEGLTLRTSIVGRQISGSTSLFQWILQNRGRKVRGFANAIYSGLTTQALAGILDSIIVDHPRLSGVHQVSSTPISKLEIIQHLDTLLELDLDIEIDTGFVIDRSLDGSHFVAQTGIQTPSWPEMLRQFAEDQSNYAGIEA